MRSNGRAVFYFKRQLKGVLLHQSRQVRAIIANTADAAIAL